MAEPRKFLRWKWTARTVRLSVLLLIVVGIAAWKFIPRPWHPTVILNTSFHAIESTAATNQVEKTGHALGLLYIAYTNRIGSVKSFTAEHPRLKVKLFRDRAEFRKINPGLGWAEAYYQVPYCRAYYSADETNPYHWMMHEATHQLNHEVAHLRLAKWLEEGLAEYFSTSKLQATNLQLGNIDPDTYPVWWLSTLATSTNLEENISNGSVIPLQSIITHRGGPSMRKHFNLYYLHWWSLTHFIFEDPRYRDRALALVEAGGGLEAFERVIGPVDKVQGEWHAHVQKLRATLPLDVR